MTKTGVLNEKPDVPFTLLPNNRLNKNERAATLIHKYIHHIQNQSGHSGREVANFNRITLGIPFEETFDNPYC